MLQGNFPPTILELDEESSGVKTILCEHPEVKILFERRYKLPLQLEINGVNPILHVLLEGIVENQLQDPDLPEVKEIIERLESEGLSRHAARGCVTRLFVELFHEVFYYKKTFDTEKYKRLLRLLGTDFVKVGRNEPCPCGSGRKFKRCCAADADLFKISKLAGLLCLGQGGYILGSPEFVIKDPLDPIMQLENRLHIARYLEKNGDLEGAIQALEENVAVAESFQEGRWLKNALQDLQLLCVNHQSLTEKGLQITERLLALAQNDGEKGNYWCDRADLLAQACRIEEAEKEYRNLFNVLPHWHFGRYRYALFLEKNGRKEEAIIVLRELVTAKGKIDSETYRAAREVLEDLKKD
ncbi:MAG: SEC-C domain-containing protein [Thermoanaerobacter sp.]|nr:SEC-C domain-containing protein [Thermoanaerobacter sp.]